MIDNFSKVEGLLNFKNPGDFYFVQIYKRRKDNPEQEKDNIIIDNFFIDSLESFNKRKKRIVEICTNNNARAYIRLNKRNQEKVALQTLRLIAENIASKCYDIKNCYTSACGQFHSDENKTWIVDIDEPSPELEIAIKACLNKLKPEGDKFVAKLPTRNGYHLITRPFNLLEFRNLYPEIDVHKDNPTVIFAP